jgi:hypothetical protein
MTHTRYYLEHLKIQIPLMPLKLDHLFSMGAQVLHHDSCPNKTLLQASSNLQIALMKLAHKGYPQILKLMYEKKNLNPEFLLHLVFPLPRSNLHLLDTRRVWLASNQKKNKSAHTKEFHLPHNTNIDFHIIQ